jgi:PleD family two-component response regulator
LDDGTEALAETPHGTEMQTDEDDARTAAAMLARQESPAGSVATSEYDGEPRFRFGLHVLVVDDEKVNRRIAARMLEHLGCTCDGIEDGDEVVNALVSSEKREFLLDSFCVASRNTNAFHLQLMT